MENKVNFKINLILKISILVFLLSPLFFQLVRLAKFTPLNGIQTSKAQTLKDSLNGDFKISDRSLQSYLEAYLDESLVVRSPLVRLRNQYEYSFFNKINAQQIYQYKDQLFRFYVRDYNESVLYLGEKVINEKVNKLHELQEYLGKDHLILTLIAPSKTYFYSDYLPQINRIQTEKSNYKKIKEVVLSKSLKLIDFNQWFLKIKNKSKAPLFGKGGIHWTLYGATLAMDSLVNYAKDELNKDFAEPKWKLNSNYEFFYNDQDLAQLLNVFKAPNDLTLRNPVFQDIQQNKKKIKALIVSDSFFDVISMTKLREQIFTNDSQYLYYFNTRKDDTNNNQVIDKTKLLEVMKSIDCVIILNDIVNMENFGWGFIEEAYSQMKSIK